jgi:hypothetical protein
MAQTKAVAKTSLFAGLTAAKLLSIVGAIIAVSGDILTPILGTTKGSAVQTSLQTLFGALTVVFGWHVGSVAAAQAKAQLSA